MNRRDFLKTASALSAGFTFPTSKDLPAHPAAYDNWRTFEVTTHVQILKPVGITRIWVPTTLIQETPFQKTIASSVQCPQGRVRTFTDPAEALGIVSAEFAPGVTPALTVTSRVATRNWASNIAGSGTGRKRNSSGLNDFLRPTPLLPTGGIVKQRATEITRSARTDADRARAIYEWIVENTRRDPKTRGCGIGNVRFMLESGDLGGKCADINTLYVALARAAGLPARDVYGVRIGTSQMGYKSLGVSSENITKAQHCRAEVYLTECGWVPVDPADVRKVMLEEPPGNRPLDDPMVKAARSRLFGSWEMNWMAYNYAQNVALPGSSGPPVRFLMYPQAETDEGRLDSLDPDRFQYQITSRSIH